ncbi:hypothetical protein KKC_15239 [Listeria fleischmannii subsp. coloradonensis]|uniref:Lipocalin-like domain-containing protein n=1 Tax=Listeria fleischmannii TaxID=1069827 RepID=A0A841YHB7_9LIST|nr:lipocalin-like domain-containing protein [Listeria fleischmannii]EIA18919.1 hypothetical protein KKC_15239 [Listeria fleischmannii subsp. coloradonensis]MBC1399795.1 lipocalin-like domain-containing protein [Listeria fleischmannii]MBC1428104.1 lipocalin-like domain-containing protein [Listeria fleischmannii]
MKLTEYLIGTWELVDYDYQIDGKKSEPLGQNPTGFLMYTPDGYVSAQMMKQGRPAYKSRDLHTGTVKEMAEAAHGYLAYAGAYKVIDFDEESNTITVLHTMSVSMNPTWLGETQKRFAQFKDGLLTITADVNDAKLIWKKVK